MADSAPVAPDTGTTQMIAPDHRVYSVPNGQLEDYTKAGYVRPSVDIDHDEIRANVDGDSGAGSAYLMSTIGNELVVKSLVAGVATSEQAKAWRDKLDEIHREHPIADFLGRGTGAVVDTIGLGALGGAAAGALGIGAAAAGEAAGATAAASGAGEAAGGSLLSGLTSSPLAAAAAKGAATNLTLGHIARIDDSAIRHSADPLGKEKIQWALNSDDLVDTALGAALPLAFGLGAKALQKVGKAGGTATMNVMTNAITDTAQMEKYERQGTIGQVRDLLDEVVRSGRKNPKDYAKIRLKDSIKTLDDLKSKLSNPYLSEESTALLKSAIRQTLGPKNRVYKSLAEDLRMPKWDVIDMQRINTKLYDQIEFSEPGLRPTQDPVYMRASELVNRGMRKVFQDNDISETGEFAQQWATGLRTTSGWHMAYKSIARGKGPAGVGQILRNTISGAAYGYVLGKLGAFGGPSNAAANNAAYQAVRSLNAYHFGQVANGLSRVMEWSGNKLANAVASGLYGLPQAVQAGTRPYFTKQEYEDTASKVAAAVNDPETAFVNVHKALVAADMPEHIAEDGALAKHAQIQFLGSKLPRRMTAPDVATLGQGDPVQQRRFMGQYRTLRDPTYGIANPTKTNMEVLQQFYPNILAAAQQATLSQLQRNPKLPTASKTWASRVLGRPINNLSSPTFSSMLQQARQQVAQRDAQGQQRSPTHRASASSAPSSATRLDELQGGQQ